MAAPRPMPSAPPTTDSTTLSVSSCRTMRPRLAPSAARTASSPVRALARASSRFATLTQQVSRTMPTTPRNMSDVSSTSPPTYASRSDSSAMPRPAFVCGNSRARPAATVPSSACAASIATPGFSRPTADQMWTPRARSGAPWIGRMPQMSLRPTSRKSWGTTPTTV